MFSHAATLPAASLSTAEHRPASSPISKVVSSPKLCFSPLSSGSARQERVIHENPAGLATLLQHHAAKMSQQEPAPWPCPQGCGAGEVLVSWQQRAHPGVSHLAMSPCAAWHCPGEGRCSEEKPVLLRASAPAWGVPCFSFKQCLPFCIPPTEKGIPSMINLVLSCNMPTPYHGAQH